MRGRRRTGLLAGLTMAFLVLTAAVAVSVASALPTVLCKVKESTCAEANRYTGGEEGVWFTLFDESGWPGTYVTLAPSGLPAASCAEQKFTNNNMKASKSGPLVGTMWNVLGSCGGSCTVAVINSPELEIEASAKKDGNGFLRVIGPIFEATCSSPTAYRCYYTAPKIQLFLEGGEVATAKGAEATLVKTAGAGATLNCPAQATASESLRFVSPGTTVYVTFG